MKKLFIGIAGAAVLTLVAILAHTASAATASIGPIGFETTDSPAYTIGTINGQNGWSKTGSYDAAVSSSAGVSGFGAQSLRISNAVTSGSFGDQTFAPALSTPAGESGANNGTFGSATPLSHFETQFSTAALPDSIGTVISVSPDRGDGARMSYLRFDNEADGIHVYFDDVQGTTNPANFVETALPTLSAATPHTVKLSIDLVDGPNNDVVKVYLDGTLVHTGTTWENYYRYDVESNPTLDPNYVPTIRTVLFRAGGTAVPANSGKGFLFDNFSEESNSVAPVAVTTNAATDITATSATLNGTNGSTAADNTSFWWGTSAAGPFTSAADPSSQFPSGWSHDSGLGAASADQAFHNGVTGLAPSTTYHFVAWVHIGGIWYPDTVLDFTTLAGQTPSVTTNAATGITDTAATLHGMVGPVNADNTSFWWGTSAAGTITAAADPSSELPAGWSHDTGLGAGAAGASFQEALTSLAPSTTYHFVAWVHANGTWYPGSVMSFTTAAAPVTTPTDPNQCKNNGWKTFTNPSFKNQGQCVSYVEHLKQHHDNSDSRENDHSNKPDKHSDDSENHSNGSGRNGHDD